jgi:hypothetical protein
LKALKFKILAAVALAAALLVPAASAKTKPKHKPVHVKLSLVALPVKQLGSPAASLAIGHESGVLSNLFESNHAFGSVSAKYFAKLGRVTGYGLDYGYSATGSTGVDEVWTSVDRYKTQAGAKKGLAFWKKDDSQVAEISSDTFTVTGAAVKPTHIGKARFGFLSTYSAANIAPLATVDEQFVVGSYVLDVTVSAGTAAQAEQLATKYAKKLNGRMQLALKGKLHAKPVELPGKQVAGPPADGPDLSQAVLAPTDFTGQATLADARYRVDPEAVSDYSAIFIPAGQFDLAEQEIEWFPTANAASFWADWDNAMLISGGGTAIDLSSVGDNAQGGIFHDPSFGDVADAVLTVGNVTDVVYLSQAAIRTNDLQAIAQAAANRLAPVVGS